MRKDIRGNTPEIGDHIAWYTSVLGGSLIHGEVIGETKSGNPKIKCSKTWYERDFVSHQFVVVERGLAPEVRDDR